jgi:diguanylate cyclase (GGDEF)-like protein
MKMPTVDFKKMFALSDSFTIIGIIVGLTIALFLPQLEIRLIGISIAILSAVVLFMNLSGRLKDLVGTKFKPGSPPPNIKITKIKSANATRQVIENFDDSFGPSNKDNKEKETPVKKDDKPIKETPKAEPFEFSDEFSGVKIIRKKAKDKKETPTSKPTKPETESKGLGTEEKAAVKEQPQYQQNIEQDNQPDWVSLLIDNEPVASEDPRKEFDYFISKILMAIRSVTNTRTAVFIFINSERDELLMESYVTEVPQAFTKNMVFPIANDIVSQIVINRKPEILTEISPSAEMELIPYYDKNIGTQSFIGLPVIMSGKVVGVLCADSDIPDAYDSQTVGFMGHFIQLIVSLVKNYIDKYELLLASKTLEAINSFRSLLFKKQLNVENVSSSLVKAASSLLQYHTIGTCIFDEASGAWKILTIDSKESRNNELNGSEIDIEIISLAGAILKPETLVLSPMDNNAVHIHPKEKLPDNGFLVAVPLKSLTYNYGCLFLIGTADTLFTSYDIKILETLGDNAGFNIEQLYFQKIIQHQATNDHVTGILLPQAFFQRLDEEFNKYLDYNIPISLMLFRIDNYSAFQSADMDKTEQVVIHVISKTQESVKKYDVIGKADENVFGVILINTQIQDAQLWAEKFRSVIASSVLEVGKKRFTATISIGLAEGRTANNYQELLSNAHRVLEIAGRKTNSVSVFG